MTDVRPLLDSFLDLLHEPQRKIVQREELEQALHQALAAAHAAWPALAVSDERFLAHLAAQLPAGAAPERALGALHVTDLYLACACIDGDGQAIRDFERQCFPVVDQVIRRLRQPPAAGDELRQHLREQLFVASGEGGPRLRAYSGRGPLRNWLRIIAVRALGKVLDREKKEVLLTESVMEGLAPTTGDPELDIFKATYRAEFATAFTTALRALTSRERILLAQHYVDRLSIDELGVIYGSHRATIARWLARAREALLKRTRATLMQQIRVDGEEYASIMRLIESQLPATFADVDREEPAS